MSTRWVPYLVMNGNAGEAADFYAKALGGEVVDRMTYADMPEGPQGPVPEEIKSRIIHVRVVSGSQELMLSDTFEGSWPKAERLTCRCRKRSSAPLTGR